MVVARGQVHVRLNVPERARALYTQPGQFVQLAPLRSDGVAEKGLFALLNAPGEGATFDLLVRTDATSGGEAAALLTAQAEGDVVPCSNPMGAGFPLERIGGRWVRVVATGTAIAPARAAIVSLLTAGIPIASLDYGVRSPDHVALRSDLQRFAAAGIDVALHYSEPAEDRVIGALAHHALARRWTLGATQREVVIAVGQLEMVGEVRAHWKSLGGDPADVLHNY